MSKNNDLVFALDIGTRTVIGLVLKKENNNFKIIDSEVVEHSKRAMLDGQIHNVTEVSKIVKKIKNELENRLGDKLKKVAIAAAGRALETINTEYEFDYKRRKYIEREDVQELEYACIQKAQNILAKSNEENNAGDYHFVGYSVMSYNLDSMYIKDLVGQKGRKIKVKLIATFLPQVVIDSLLSVIQRADLEVDYLTLEPIAASKLVIPEEMYNFNLVLIDIGAGTSDIAITKGGSMIGYAMVPVAGDEITEKISEKYMLEYNKAEKAKRSLGEKKEYKTSTILGNEIIIEKEETLDFIKPQIKEMVELIISKVVEINDSLPKAVMCVGGGSLTPLLKEELVKGFDLPESRIGIRNGSNLENITGEIDNIKGPQSLTPIGIAVSAFNNSSETIFANVEVNGQNIQIFSLNTPNIS
ncbi:MAG: cell division protein FtsA, partial [Halanaerobiales bacterium]